MFSEGCRVVRPPSDPHRRAAGQTEPRSGDSGFQSLPGSLLPTPLIASLGWDLAASHGELPIVITVALQFC